MSFDIILAIIAALSQVVMAVLGTWVSLRPPKPEHHWRIITGFAVVGLVGVGAIIWEGIDARRDTVAITSGITSLQTGQKSGFSSIGGQIASLPKLAPPPPPSGPQEVRIAPASLPASKVVITRYDVTALPTGQGSTGDMGLKIWYKNIGPGVSFTPRMTAFMQISAPVNQPYIDKEMATLRAAAFKHLPERDEELVTGQEYFFPGWRVVASDWQDVLQSKKQMYVFAVVTYGDNSIPKSKFWVQEFVAVQSGDPSVYTIVEQKTYLNASKH